MHVAMDTLGNSIRIIITEGTTADCTKVEALIDGFSARYLLADRGYDSDSIISLITQSGMIPIIPPKRDRTIQRDYDKDLYKPRHLVDVIVPLNHAVISFESRVQFVLLITMSRWLQGKFFEIW